MCVGAKSRIECCAYPTWRLAGLALLLCIAIAAPAQAYVGEGYLQIPGAAGDWKGSHYPGWIRIDGRYWGEGSFSIPNGTGASRARAFYSGPSAPVSGPSELIVSLNKKNTDVAKLMRQCQQHTALPQITFAESADGYRNAALELGDRPASIPAYFEYLLKDVQVVACPLAKEAPEQGFVLRFGNIQWLNYRQKESAPAASGDAAAKGMIRPVPVEGTDLTLSPSMLPPAHTSGRTKTFIVSWFGFAHDVSDDQCPMMSKKPSAEDFGLKPADPDSKQGAASLTNDLENRGPDSLNVCLLPGVASDPGNPSPQTKIARGLNLDGNDGAKKTSRASCRHAKFLSKDGRTAIDNQFYRVAGCIPGLLGKKGLWQQVLNDEWRNGAASLLIQVSGIDDDQNDDDVDVTILYSEDHPAKDVTGQDLLTNYTFRVSDNPEFTHYFRRLHGRILNGVIETEQTSELDLNMVKGPSVKLADAKLRLEIGADGNLRGLLGGYEDWRYLSNYYNFVGFEITFGFQCPGLYNALKRDADGIVNPETGECDGISIAYDIEGVPAFIPPSQQERLMQGVNSAPLIGVNVSPSKNAQSNAPPASRR